MCNLAQRRRSMIFVAMGAILFCSRPRCRPVLALEARCSAICSLVILVER